MHSPAATVLTYYLGFGFVIFLFWVVALPDRQLDEVAANRYLTWITVAAFVGLAHPAIALANFDVMKQVGIEMPEDNDALQGLHARLTTFVNAMTIMSVTPALLVSLSVR